MIITKSKKGRVYQQQVRETSPSTWGLTTRRRRNRGRQIEPMIDYKYSTIASGATPIGSAKRAPDRKEKKSSSKDEEATVKELMDTVRAVQHFDNHETSTTKSTKYIATTPIGRYL
jgi:hypothetical protein